MIPSRTWILRLDWINSLVVAPNKIHSRVPKNAWRRNSPTKRRHYSPNSWRKPKPPNSGPNSIEASTYLLCTVPSESRLLRSQVPRTKPWWCYSHNSCRTNLERNSMRPLMLVMLWICRLAEMDSTFRCMASPTRLRSSSSRWWIVLV